MTFVLMVLSFILTESQLISVDITSQNYEEFKPNDRCNIVNVAASTGLFSRWYAKSKKLRWRLSESNHGAIIRVWALEDQTSSNRSSIMEQYECQLRSQAQYCTQHGYKCYLFVGRNEPNSWDLERKHDNLPPHWVKIQAIRDILPYHPWVLYLDFDNYFYNVTGSSSVEAVLQQEGYNNASILVPNEMGWNSDTIFLINNNFSNHFIHHIWELRNVCPRCVGEQCAVTLGMFDVLVNSLVSKHLKGEYEVARDDGYNCCDPGIYCEFPRTLSNIQNSGASYNVQGCVWQWQRMLEIQHPDLLKQTDLFYLPDFRDLLGFEHGIKERSSFSDNCTYISNTI